MLTYMFDICQKGEGGSGGRGAEKQLSKVNVVGGWYEMIIGTR